MKGFTMRKIFPIILAIILIAALFFGFVAACQNQEAVLRFIHGAGTTILVLLASVFVLTLFCIATRNAMEPKRNEGLLKTSFWAIIICLGFATTIALIMIAALFCGFTNAYFHTPEAVLGFVFAARKAILILLAATLVLMALFCIATVKAREHKDGEGFLENSFWGVIICLGLTIILALILAVALLVCVFANAYGNPKPMAI